MAGDPDAYADTYELLVPIFVVTHTPPPVAPKRNERLFLTFVTDGVRDAVTRAVGGGGGRAVTVVGGAHLTRQLLAPGLVHELRVDVMPVLLGTGLRLFEETGPLALVAKYKCLCNRQPSLKSAPQCGQQCTPRYVRMGCSVLQTPHRMAFSSHSLAGHCCA